jgi:hypothetical protein
MGGDVGIPRRFRRYVPQACAASLFLSLGLAGFTRADTPPGPQGSTPPEGSSSDAPPPSLSQQNFFSSIKQSLRLGYDHEVVRGHFDLGTAPNSHRYYCLVDTKTRQREPNGVLGVPVPLPDGTTALKVDSVSLFGCDDAEKHGMLITAGYLLKAPNGAPTAPAPAAAAATAPAPPSPVPPAPSAPPPAPPVPAPAAIGATPDGIDVAGIKLGMPLAEVRTALKAKKLREYTESTETLSYLDSDKGAMQSMTGGRFVNVIAAWTPPLAGDGFEAEGESYSVMFTPVPGKERVMAIVHSVGYSPANAIRETVLENGLVNKYGGFADSNNLPDAPTWRYQHGGNVLVGDACNRRALFGGLGALTAANPARGNLVLKKTPDELSFQVDHCGVALVTEDHYIANGGALREDRLVTRFTVTAYSPSIALDAAGAAAGLIQAAKGAANKDGAARLKEQPAPNL